MKRLTFIIISLLFFAASGHSAIVSFEGSNKKVLNEKPASNTGLNDIYVVYNAAGVSVKYTAKTSSAVVWYRYSNLGGGYAEEISGITHQGNVYTLPKLDSDMGYIIEEGTSRYYFWVVDYSRHYFDIASISIALEQECDVAALNPVGSGSAIKFYTINGQTKELDRGIELAYSTLEWNTESAMYSQIEKTETFSSLSETIRVQAPLCNTEFTLTGDKFLKQWGESVSAVSPLYNAIAVDAQTSAVQTVRDNANEKKDDTAPLGGSAPAEIEFTAASTDAAIFNEWQFATDAEFENITLRINEPVYSHTFNEHGSTYVRFVASNEVGTCDYYGETYEVSIGASSIECPNAFSPDASEGVNDEWKVSYESIISFECYIFNRWGVKVAEFHDPAQGWDGKHNGKYVPAGVYYYVIKAKGADGRNYNLKGDINIIKYKFSPSATETE